MAARPKHGGAARFWCLKRAGSCITNNRDTTRTQSFTYDALNRIATAKTSSTSGSHCWGDTYTIDQWANLKAISYVSGYTGCSQGTFSVLATANNQLSATGYAYDLSGNMLNDASNQYTFNAESEITSAAGVNYTYDGDGNRVEKSGARLYWYGAGTEILDETDLSGNVQLEFVYFGGRRVAHRIPSSGNIYYYEEDMLGSSRTIVQAGQTAPCFDADYLPFGGERDITSTCSQSYNFEGKKRDPETGNDDFGARYYSSRLSRWLSPDWSAVPAPVPYANLTNPQTLNLYAMVSDNPETFADLDGHCNTASTGSVPGDHNVCAGPAATKNGKKGEGQKTGDGTKKSLTQRAQKLAQVYKNIGQDMAHAARNAGRAIGAVARDPRTLEYASIGLQIGLAVGTDGASELFEEEGSELLGSKGAQITSKTLLEGDAFRIDVENPAPGERAGQIHVQFGGKGSARYIYDPSSKSFIGLSQADNEKLLSDPKVQAAIQKGLRFLGVTP